MKLLHRCLLFGAFVTLLTSCMDEAPWEKSISEGDGSIDLMITSSDDVSSEVPSVRSVDVKITTPPSEQFSIKLTKTDGSYSKTWSTVHDFVSEKSFAAGNYTIEVFYNLPTSIGIVQPGDKGYEHAYYYGKQENIVVKAGQTTIVQLHAAIANSIVAIEYTDAFKNYFKDWGTKLTTKGTVNTTLDMENQEGYAYICPGNVDVLISATLQNNKSFTLSPTSFETEARHIYKIRYNVYNDEVGQVDILSITFNDQPEVESVKVNLSDELLNSEPPVINTMPEDLKDNETVKVSLGSVPTQNIGFNITAEAGFESAELTVLSGDSPYNDSFLSDKGIVDFCKITSSDLSNIEAAGIKTTGFNDTKSKYGVIDLREYCSKLPKGTYTFGLKIDDTLKRSEGKQIKVQVGDAPELKIEVKPAMFGFGYADLTINCGGVDPTLYNSNPFTFKVDGQTTETRIMSWSRNGDGTLSFKIELPYTNGDNVPLQVYLNGSEINDVPKIVYEYPDYDLEFDAFARKILFRFNPSTDKNTALNKENFNWYVKRLKVVSGTSGWSFETPVSNAMGVYTIEGANQATEYGIKSTLKANPSDSDYKIYTVITETETDVPNGDLRENGKHIYNSQFPVGGQWHVPGSSFYLYNNYVELDMYEPDKWTTLNDLTFYEGSKTINSWFMVPSTFKNQDGSVTIRSVGYHHNGIIPNYTGGGSVFSPTTYCTNVPNELDKSIGELFLGTFTFNGNKTRLDGINFGSRPSKLTFNYSYSSYDNETGLAVVKLLDENNNVISQNSIEIEAQGGTSTHELDLKNYPFGVKASKVEISFKSTGNTETPSVKIPTGSELDEGIKYVASKKTNIISGINNYHALATGSELRISNVHFSYE